MSTFSPVEDLSGAESQTETEHEAQTSTKVIKLHLKEKKFLTRGPRAQGGKLPPCGFITPQKAMYEAKVPLKRAPPLDITCVCSQRAGKKDKGAVLFSGERSFRSYSTIRCFSATTTVTQSGVTERGIGDLANMVYYSTSYQQAMAKAKLDTSDKRFLSVPAGEFLSGLPKNWTSSTLAVDVAQVRKMFPVKGGSRMSSVSLFSGVGGLDLGLAPFLKPCQFVEWDPYCQSVLTARMKDGLLPQCSLAGDVCSYVVKGRAAKADVLSAGFPCQGLSAAGSQGGLSDSRTGLLKTTFKVWDQMDSPSVLFLENVNAILSEQKNCRELFLWLVEACLRRGLRLQWVTVRLTNCGLPANRARTFLMAVRPESAVLQDFYAHADHFADLDWNSAGSIPLTEWLCAERGQEEKEQQLQHRKLAYIPAPMTSVSTELKTFLDKLSDPKSPQGWDLVDHALEFVSKQACPGEEFPMEEITLTAEPFQTILLL